MKKILNIIILFAAVVFCGCSDFDDSELRGRIDGYKNRIEALKAKAETLGKQLADLSYLTNGNVITTVSQDADGKYVVTYKDNKDVEHTVVLATMDDIVDVPIIGVKLDENGVYYWTKCIDGEITWLTDDDGEKFPVSGYTPTISVDADGCWTVDGVQILDASGNPIKATTDATSVFRSAELDGDGNFSLTLGDGSTITLRVFNSLNLKLDAMPVTTVADPSKSITVSYELSGEAKETAIVAVAKAEGLDAVIDRDAKTVTVSFDASFSRGTVIVMAYDLADNVIVKPLFYKAATLGTVAISTPDQLVAFAVAGDTTHGYAAGIAGQTNDNNTAIDGCENYGAVLSDIINAAANKYIGIVCANTNKKTIAIRNCKIGGRIGPFSDGQQGATEITEQNFEQYIYFTLTGGGVPTLENNSFSGGPAKPGIATVEDLTAFRDAVNAGESTAQWEDAGGVVSLLGDIDMKDVAGWTPIGNASYKWEKNLLTIEGNAFKGTFDGQGYALKNLKLAYGGSAVNTAYGLFGVLDGATVRNLTVGAALGDASALKVTASGGTAEVGVIAGVCRDANVSDCVNYAKIEYDGTSAARVSAAMVGFIFSETEGTKLERLQNYGAVEADTHGNSANGAGAAIHMAGICGFATGNATNKICNDIAYCDNYGNITSNSARSSGIVAAANTFTRINSCVNHGNQLNSCGTTGRLGNITCITGTGCSMTDCINNGNLVSTGGARCGGLLSLANHATNSFCGCANYGEILTDDANRGVFFGYSAYATSWINCIAGGKVGVYNGGTAVYDSYGENEQVRYLGVQKSTDPINADNITYMIGSSSGGSGGGDDIEPTLRILFIGNSFTKDAVEHLPKMVSAADIPTLKMVHLYYGGRTIPEYADGYATKSDYTCYKYNPGTSLWLSYTGYNIQQIVKSDTWDIVCLQEHTGNSCGWIWNDTEKNAIQGLIADIRADQNGHTPKFVYIMSQAYFNMDKIGTAQRPYKNFTTQDEMFDVIVAQARKVLDQTDVEQIIPTGTVLQNLRTSSLNNDMDLTRDGYHMDYGLSRYAAACAVFESIISPSFGGKKLDGNSFRYNVSSTTDGTYTTPVTDDNQPVALQAARYALATPFAVTDMSSGTQTPGNGIEDTDFENDSNKE